MNYSLPSTSVHGISQARILEWIAISSSKGSSQSKDQTWVSWSHSWKVNSLPLCHRGSPNEAMLLLLLLLLLSRFSHVWLCETPETISRSFHIAVNGIISFFFMTEQCSIVCLYHIIFVHSSANGHGCFHVLAFVNSAAENIEVHVSFWIMVLSGYMPRGGIAGSYDSSIFSF